MAHFCPDQSSQSDKIEHIKSVSGRMIEERRKRARMTQSQLAGRVGIGVRWLREIESGNPKSAIENHLRCAFALGLEASHLFIPLIFMENGVKFPLQLLLDDPSDLNQRCVDLIGDYYVEAVARQLRPNGNRSDAVRAG